MFELGARPHPPRTLYRAYLEQSDIFVGIYGEQYGWVAPGEEISGLEDEWNLAPDIPKLIYLKRSEHRQEPRSTGCSSASGTTTASYVSFTDAEELVDLVTADLATLLAERFDAAGRPHGALPEPTPGRDARPRSSGLPSPLTRLLGREGELAAVTRMLADDGRRLVTITGPGGIGKSRLAIAAARAVEAEFPDGIVFVDLAPVVDPALVIPAVANALGIRDSGSAPLEETLRIALADRRVLLVLDNVEQVIDAAPRLSACSRPRRSRCSPRAASCCGSAASRASTLGPLPRPRPPTSSWSAPGRSSPTSSRPTRTRRRVAAICAALDGAPLALELAAARVRVLTPAAIVDRLDHALPLLAGGARDLPERQRTIRATIEWSTRLLREEERELLLRLGVFRSGCSLDAVEWMSGGLDCEPPSRRSAPGRREPRARAGPGCPGLVRDCSASCASTPGRSSRPAASSPTSRTGMRSSTSASPRTPVAS